jgi:hydroxymethylbilane synthase
MQKPLIIGTRGSDLALWQARFTQEKLSALGIASEIKIIKTQGDQIQNLSFDKMEGKGFFTKELEDALLSGTIDLAVHSLKDVETQANDALCLVAIFDRQESSDTLLIHKNAVDLHKPFSLKSGAVVGTSSVRRQNQWLFLRPDCQVKTLRGNVPTRVEKLALGEYDAIILASAGLARLQLDLSAFRVVPLNPREFVSAPAQGALAIQIRQNDTALKEQLKVLNNVEDDMRTQVERGILQEIGGGCQVPLGVFSCKDYKQFKTWVSYSKTVEDMPLRLYYTGENPKEIAQTIAKALKSTDKKQAKTVFISREVDETSPWFRYLAHNGVQVFGEPLIEIISVPFSAVPDCDWIFFNSKNAVEYFFNRTPKLPEHVKIGVLGDATLHALHAWGKEADFSSMLAEPKKVAVAFKELLELENPKKSPTVLFPQSGESLRTVQSELTFGAKIIELTVYRTANKSVESIPDADYYAFTSPSNVKSFFVQKNNLNYSKHKMVAMGKSTYDALKDMGILQVLQAEKPSELGIADAIMSDLYLKI